MPWHDRRALFRRHPAGNAINRSAGTACDSGIAPRMLGHAMPPSRDAGVTAETVPRLPVRE
jgi:hypothetical protein